jgi:hypothetical protein
LPGQPELVPELDEVVVPLEVEELVVPLEVEELEVLPELLPDEVLELKSRRTGGAAQGRDRRAAKAAQRILLLCGDMVDNGLNCASAHHHRDADCSTKQGIFDGACAGSVSPEHRSPLAPRSDKSILDQNLLNF